MTMLINPFRLGIGAAGVGGLFMQGQMATSYAGRTGSSPYSVTMSLDSLSPAEGDLCVIQLFGGAVNGGNYELNTGEGYTEILRSFADYGGDMKGIWYYKILGSGEDSVVIDTGSSSSVSVGVMVNLFRGADQTNPFDVSPAVAVGSDVTVYCPPVEPISEGAIALFTGNASVGGPHTNANLDNLQTLEATGATFTSWGMSGTLTYDAAPLEPDTFDPTLSDADRTWNGTALVIRPEGTGEPAFSYAPILPGYSLLAGGSDLPEAGVADTLTVAFSSLEKEVDDIMLVTIFMDNYGGGDPGLSITPPAGWALYGSQIVDGGRAMAVYWIRYTGVESASPAFNYTATTAGLIAGSATILRGAASSGTPFEGFASNSGTGTTLTGSAVTSTVDNTRVLSIWGLTDNITVNVGDLWSKSSEYLTGAGGDAGIVVSARELVEAGTMPADAATIASSESWINISFAVKPA